MTKVLLVDADADLLDVLGYALRRRGYSVATAPNGEQGLRSWQTERPDLVLLEGNLPHVDGFEVCRRIREQEARTPIILLTERSAESQVLEGFDAGADDYVPKPFSLKQLLARMDAVLRRYAADADPMAAGELTIGDLTLDPDTQRVTRAGQVVALTRIEFQLFYCLAVNAGRTVTYSRLIDMAWDQGVEASSSSITAHIANVRQKLGLSRSAPGGIQAVTSIGYRLIVP